MTFSVGIYMTLLVEASSDSYLPSLTWSSHRNWWNFKKRLAI